MDVMSGCEFLFHHPERRPAKEAEAKDLINQILRSLEGFLRMSCREGSNFTNISFERKGKGKVYLCRL